MTHLKLRKSRGFTLVEMLIVIAIIGILGAIAYPIGRSVINKGKQEESKVRMKEFESAFNGYNNDQGRYPNAGDNLPTADAELDETKQIEIIKILLNLDEDYSSGTVYLDTPNAKKGRNGLVYTGDVLTGLRDAWGQPYFMKIDYDYDGIIEQSKGSGNLQGSVKSKPSIMISSGINGVFGGDEKDDLGSW